MNRPEDDREAHTYPLNGLLCSLCGLPQHDTPSGATCTSPEGHGGAPGVTPQERREQLLQHRAEPDSRIVLLDLETPGILPGRGPILEIGVRVLTPDLEVIPVDSDFDTVTFHRLIQVDVDAVRANADAVVVKMHEESGLWSALAYANGNGESKTIGRVQSELIAWLHEKHRFPLRTAVICGSSVHFDRSWIVEHMPLLDAFLHYRMFDISAIREAYRRWVDPAFSKNWRARNGDPLHRVVPDLDGSLKELRFFRDRCFTPGGRA